MDRLAGYHGGKYLKTMVARERNRTADASLFRAGFCHSHVIETTIVTSPPAPKTTLITATITQPNARMLEFVSKS